MARVARIALDITLYSIKTVRPVVTKVWGITKSSILKTKASVIVNNPVVPKIENTINYVTNIVQDKLASLRDSQLPREQKYLEEELKKIKQKLGGGGGKGAICHTVQSTFEAAWPYIKIECVPPMTTSIFNGPFGDKLASAGSGAMENFTNAIRTAIKNIDDAAERQKKAAEEKIKAAQEKIKAEELKKKEEAQKKIIEAQKAVEAKAAEEKKAADAKTAVKTKSEVKTAVKPKSEVKKAAESKTAVKPKSEEKKAPAEKKKDQKKDPKKK